jgi:hypothetical protein
LRAVVGGKPPRLQVPVGEIVERGCESVIPTELIQLGTVF